MFNSVREYIFGSARTVEDSIIESLDLRREPRNRYGPARWGRTTEPNRFGQNLRSPASQFNRFSELARLYGDATLEGPQDDGLPRFRSAERVRARYTADGLVAFDLAFPPKQSPEEEEKRLAEQYSIE